MCAQQDANEYQRGRGWNTSLPCLLRLLTLVSGCLLLFGCAEKSSSSGQQLSPPPSSSAPEKTAKEPSSSTIQQINIEQLESLLSKKPEKVRVVNFWATWCEPCVEEMPDFVKLHEEFSPKGMELLSVSADHPDDIVERVQPFVEKMDMRFPVYVVGGESPADLIRAVDPQWQGSLPATFVYDSNGKKVQVWYEKVTYDQLAKVAGEVLKGDVEKGPSQAE